MLITMKRLKVAEEEKQALQNKFDQLYSQFGEKKHFSKRSLKSSIRNWEVRSHNMNL